MLSCEGSFGSALVKHKPGGWENVVRIIWIDSGLTHRYNNNYNICRIHLVEIIVSLSEKREGMFVGCELSALRFLQQNKRSNKINFYQCNKTNSVLGNEYLQVETK